LKTDAAHFKQFPLKIAVRAYKLQTLLYNGTDVHIVNELFQLSDLTIRSRLRRQSTYYVTACISVVHGCQPSAIELFRSKLHVGLRGTPQLWTLSYPRWQKFYWPHAFLSIPQRVTSYP